MPSIYIPVAQKKISKVRIDNIVLFECLQFLLAPFEAMVLLMELKEGIVSDIVHKEQDDLPEKNRIRNLTLSSSSLPFQNIPDYHRPICAVQKR